MLEHPILAIDHGDARIGLACTDPIGIAVHSIATVPKANGRQKVGEYIREKGILAVVVGLPLMKDGREGDSAQKARAFIAQLKEDFPTLPISFIDESFSTIEASEKLHQAGINSKKQKSIIDQAAAMEILSRYLEENGEGEY